MEPGPRTGSKAVAFQEMMASVLENKDLLIFTAKQEELTKVLARFRNDRLITMAPDSQRIEDDDGNNRWCYYPGELNLRNGSVVKFALTTGFRQGPQSFAIFATRVLTQYPSKYALMVGICAGDPDKGMKLNDVVFACKSFNYEEGKRKAGEDDGEVFQPEYEPYDAAGGVENEVKALLGSSTRDRYKSSPMVAGASVQENAKKVFVQCQGTHRKIAALDMESSAFFAACYHCNVKALPVIKAVSDAGDQNKDDSQHGKALENAAVAAIDFVEHYFEGLNEHKRRELQITGCVVKKRKIDEFRDDGGQSREVAAQASENKPSDPVPSHTLSELSRMLVDSWKRVAMTLGFKPYEVRCIANDASKPNDQEKALQMLTEWINSDGKGRGATKGVLKAALKNTDQSKLADDLEL